MFTFEYMILAVLPGQFIPIKVFVWKNSEIIQVASSQMNACIIVNGMLQAKFDAVEALASIAGDAGVSVTHLALAWNATHPAISSVLIGPRTSGQLDDLLAAARTDRVGKS